jgi:hypothetical protein
MLRTALAVFLAGCITASGQVQKDTPAVADKVDRATAYYHYTLAHMYAEMAAASGGRSREYVNKSIENYKAAVKADPHTPVLLQGPDNFPVLWLPLAQPSRIPRKANPPK